MRLCRVLPFVVMLALTLTISSRIMSSALWAAAEQPAASGPPPAASSSAPAPSSPASSPRDVPILRAPADLVFEPSKLLPDGATQAMLRRDPATGGVERFVRFPANLHIPPHWHSSAECVVVIDGSATLSVGEEKKTLGPGAYAWIPARAAHEAWIGKDGALVLQRFAAAPDRHEARAGR